MRVSMHIKRGFHWSAALLLLGSMTVVTLWYRYPFPQTRLSQWAVSPMVQDTTGRHMLGIISEQETWHLPISIAEISPWLLQATIATEDKRFYRHRGVDPLAVFRATLQNLQAGRILSGASTLDMQVCRMMDGRDRTLAAKLIESFRALQLNRIKSKSEILAHYLNIAPYGGNLRGVEAAARRYFTKRAKDLSLPEAALIAGLPQSPTRLRPDRHLVRARQRQHIVLDRMVEQGFISPQQGRDAKAFPLTIDATTSEPEAPHAAWWALNRRPHGGRTCIDLTAQGIAEEMAQDHLGSLPAYSDIAIVVIDIPQASIKAMVGSADPLDPVDGQVNGALARRSPGSALKPFIYATALEARRLNRKSTVHDIPINRGGWSPSNFDRQYRGTVTVAQALRWSLNVPAILVAEAMGPARCCGTIESAGISLPAHAPTRGGLALAVGGMEVTLLDLTNGYATLGRAGIQRPPCLFADDPSEALRALDPQVCAIISDCLSSHRRLSLGLQTCLPPRAPWFMWKTGTSSGRKDAWAVGHNGRYAIGVWVGRFSGAGHNAYVGAQAAEPLLVSLFTHPHFKTDTTPQAPEPLPITRPLVLPKEKQDRLRILQPAPRESFICVSGQAPVHIAANRQQGLQWFLNGRLLTSPVKRLPLSPGHYELRCLAPQTNDSSSVRFAVYPGQR
jgi:penicillin-binding protein 1C